MALINIWTPVVVMRVSSLIYRTYETKCYVLNKSFEFTHVSDY